MEASRRKIGIMGGTFDPIHIGHLILGEKAYEQLKLDKVLFMPSGNPPHKRNRPGRADDKQRVEMVRRAISGNEHFELSLEEMHKDGYIYTYRTLERLRREHPDTDYYFIIGGDSLFDFPGWMKPERISRACTIVAATRDHIPNRAFENKLKELSETYEGDFIRLNTQTMDVSSREIRRWIREGLSVRYYLPDTVRQYIKERSIYKEATQ